MGGISPKVAPIHDPALLRHQQDASRDSSVAMAWGMLIFRGKNQSSGVPAIQKGADHVDLRLSACVPLEQERLRLAKSASARRAEVVL